MGVVPVMLIRVYILYTLAKEGFAVMAEIYMCDVEGCVGTPAKV